MPSPSPVAPPSPRPPIPTIAVTLAPAELWPKLGPSYPKAGAWAVVAIALAYFSLGVAVGALLRQSPTTRRWLPWLVVPGVLAGFGFLAWAIGSLR